MGCCYFQISRKVQRMKNTKRRKGRKKRNPWRKPIVILIILAVLVIAALWGRGFLKDKIQVQNLSKTETPQWIDKQMIDVDGVSRNGKKLSGVKDIVIHYVGNPGSTAQGNRDFYAGSQSSVSSHFVVGLKGK